MAGIHVETTKGDGESVAPDRARAELAVGYGGPREASTGKGPRAAAVAQAGREAEPRASLARVCSERRARREVTDAERPVV